MSQSNIDLSESLKNSSSDSDKDDVRVSESKKVRLEADSYCLSYPGRDLLEADNMRLNSELKATKETNEHMESKVLEEFYEALENQRVRLEVELGKLFFVCTIC